MRKKRKIRTWRDKAYYTDSGCLVCDNKVNQDGYMRVGGGGLHRTSKMAHVLMWEEKHGPVPEGMELNHKCLNRACFNTDHLELMDGSAHATHTNVNRVGYIMDRQLDSVVAEMYTRVKYGGESINNICKEYDCKRSTLSSIMNKRSRCGVTDAVDVEHAGQHQHHVPARYKQED